MWYPEENRCMGGIKMAKWVKVLGAKPGDLSPDPGTHMYVEREHQPLHVVL